MLQNWDQISIHSLTDGSLCSLMKIELRLTDWENPNLIEDRATERSKVINPGVVERAEECESGPGCNGFELETYSLELSFSSGFEGSFEAVFSCKCFDHHVSMATILPVSYAECEIVELVGNCSKDLGNGAFSSCEEFNCSKAEGDVEVLFVYELHSFEGLNDPTGQRGCEIFLFGREEDTIGRVDQQMRTFLESTVLDQVICKKSLKGY